jgi:hypothetical protein
MMGSRKVGLKSGIEARLPQKKPKIAQSTQSIHLAKIKFLIASGTDQQKLSRTVEAILKDIKGTKIRFQTDSMEYDGIHLAYDDSPLFKNKLIVELALPEMDRKIKALAEVVWFEKSFNDREMFYHVEAEIREMSDEDKEVLEEYKARLRK